MFKLIGKEINEIIGAQTILIWAYDIVSIVNPLKRVKLLKGR